MVTLGRSVFNPRWDERDSIPRDLILDGLSSEESAMDEADVSLEGGFMKGMKKRLKKYGPIAIFTGPPPVPGIMGIGFTEGYTDEQLEQLAGLGDEEADEPEDADELAGIWLGALTIDEFKDRVAKLVERRDAASTAAAALTPAKAASVALVSRRTKLQRLVDRLQQMAAQGTVAEGLLMVGERRMTALEDVIKNKQLDVAERPYGVEKQTARTLYRSQLKAMKRQAREARRAAKRERMPSYYGHQQTEIGPQTVMAQKPWPGFGPPYGRAWGGPGWGRGRGFGPGPWGRQLRGINLGFDVTSLITKVTDYGSKAAAPNTFGDYIDRVNNVAGRWQAVQDRAKALSQASADAIQRRAEELNVARRTPELIDSVRGTTTPVMDVVKLQKVEERLPLLENLVNTMVAQPPPIITDDGENARAAEYLREELDRALAEKKAALAAQKGPLGVPWMYWGIGGGSALLLGGAIWMFSGGRK